MESIQTKINIIPEKELFNYPWGSWYRASACTGTHLIYESKSDDIPTGGLENAVLEYDDAHFHDFAAIVFMKKRTHEAYDFAKFHINYLYEKYKENDLTPYMEICCKFDFECTFEECLNNNDLFYRLCEKYIDDNESQYRE